MARGHCKYHTVSGHVVARPPRRRRDRERSCPHEGLRFTSDTPMEPEAGRWKLLCPPDATGVALPPPPDNCSAQTRAELQELVRLTSRRTEAEIKQILRWSRYEPTALSNWDILAEELAGRYGLSVPAGARVCYALTMAIQIALITAWNNKYKYLRPRPHLLDQAIDVSVIPVPQHPAYPAGHSAVAGAAATVLSQFFPAETDLAHALAEDAGISRLLAGIHYRSDHTKGLLLGRIAAETVIPAVLADGGPTGYDRPADFQPLSLSELLRMVDYRRADPLPPPAALQAPPDGLPDGDG